MQERRLAVLRAIVEDYVTTREPVGSKALVERHQLGVSSATVRNDMAALEEEGLIAHPHTSAGRIPTDKGYRFFVDRLAQIKPMSSAERRAIESFLEGAYDLDDVISRSVRLLAQLTQQVAIIQYPTMSTSTIRHIEVVALSSSRVLLVLILSTGRVEQLVVEVPVEVDDELVGTLRLWVNEAVATKPITEAVRSLETLSERVTAEYQTTATLVAVCLMEALSSQASDQRVVVGGTSNLANFGEGFQAALQPMLEALEEHVVLLRLMGEAHANGVRVQIGSEGPVEELASTSVISAGYGPSSQTIGSLGVVGPTRMDYPGTMTAVHTVASYISHILEKS